MIYIYGLIDPDTRKIRYIGKSVRPKERLQNQMNELSNCHRSHWLQELKRNGKRPYQITLQELEDSEPWQEWEKAWIKHGRESGWPLTNNTDGGDGVCNLPVETRQRMARVWLGRKHSAESLERLRIARAQRITTDETRKRISAAMAGRQITWRDKISASNRKLSQLDIASILDALNSGASVVSLSNQYGVHRTTISKVKKGKY
jgi:predicted kinase